MKKAKITPQNFTSMAELIFAQIRAGCQAFHLVIGGQGKLAVALIKEVERLWNDKFHDERKQMTTVEWIAKKGVIQFEGDSNSTANPIAAIDYLLETEEIDDKRSFLCVFHDLVPHMQNPVLVSYLRRLIGNDAIVNPEKQRRRPFFFLTVHDEMHADLVPYLIKHDMPYPTKDELKIELDGMLDNSDRTRETAVDIRQKIVLAGLGMTMQQAKDAIGTAIIRRNGVDAQVPEFVITEKAKSLKSIAGLEYVPAEDVQSTEIGGYGLLKVWIRRRVAALRSDVAEVLDRPKGIALYGIPGAGKSVAARVIAREMDAALVRFDVGAIFGSLVGQSERQMRDAIKAATAIGRVVLLMDEIDKMIGGAHESSGDSGVSRRLLGALLTWMAEKDDEVFVVATLNRTAGLPSELLRKGRFDDVFFVDLPTKSERAEILNIHLGKRRLCMSDKDITKLLESTESFSGAELEQVVVSAAYAAAEDGKLAAAKENPTSYLVPVVYALAAAKETKPLAKVDGEGIKAIRDFGIKRLTPVAQPEVGKTTESARLLALHMENGDAERN